jgi:chromosome segregation ATPase
MSIIREAIKAIRLVKAGFEGDQSVLQKQFVDEKEEERQRLRERALDMIGSAKYYLERLNEGLLEDIIHNRLRDIVSGVSVELSDLNDNIERARELLSYLALQMEKEKPDIEMVNEICGRLEMLLRPLQDRIRQVFEETKEQVEAARERVKLPSLGEHELKRIATILHSLSEVINEIPQYAEELRKPIRKPRASKVKPRFGWLP